MLSGLAADLFREERIRTTETKAKRLRPVAERLITLGKDGSVHARRRALSVVEDRDIVHKLFAEIAPRYVSRNGGYTRILKLGTRQGDGASMALIELVEGTAPTAPASTEAPGKRRRGIRRRGRREQEGRGTAKPSETSEEASLEQEDEEPLPTDEVVAEQAEADMQAEQASAQAADAGEAAEQSDVKPSEPGAAGEEGTQR